VEWANAGSLTRAFYGSDYGLTTDLKSHYPETTPATEAAKREIPKADNQIQSCFMCHARRGFVHPDYKHGEPIFKSFKPEPLREPLYHPDGQINEEVYVYGSYTQSKMYHQGVACSDCHDPHTTKLKAPGNALCLRCHDAGKYETSDHHFHEPGTAGASCVECHMPEKTYMQVDPRRDHSIRIPRPDLSVELGTPNACNRCHTEKDAQWAAEAVKEHHGPDRPSGSDFAHTFAAGRNGEPGALKDLVELAEAEDRPNIVRATALELLRNYPQSSATDTLRAATEAEDPLMRVTAVAALDRLPPPERREAAAPLLEDPMRVVRMEAARILSAVPTEELKEEQRQAFDEALAEYKTGQRNLLDGPDGNLNLGNLYDNLGESDKAIERFKTAAEMDPELIPPRMNLAHLHNRLGRNDKAEQRLREVLKHHPDYGEAHYSLGLLLAEDSQRIGEAVEHLGRAAELMPERPRVLYNYSLALQKIGRGRAAERALLRAHDLAPESADILNALAIYYYQRRQWDEAYTYAEKLAEVAPNAPGPQRLLRQLRQRMLQDR
jgi:predicted CXXCH cytochrome family protein